MKNVVLIQEVKPSFTNRRSFLKISGLTLVGTSLLLSGCNNDDNNKNDVMNQFPGVKNGVFDLGAGDFGVLTYAYALEQLEADFYTKVVNASGFTTNFTAQDQIVLTDLYRHEVIHKEFFKTALTGALPNPTTQLLPSLAFNYGALNFNSRAEVLATAKAFIISS